MISDTGLPLAGTLASVGQHPMRRKLPLFVGNLRNISGQEQTRDDLNWGCVSPNFIFFSRVLQGSGIRRWWLWTWTAEHQFFYRCRQPGRRGRRTCRVQYFWGDLQIEAASCCNVSPDHVSVGVGRLSVAHIVASYVCNRFVKASISVGKRRVAMNLMETTVKIRRRLRHHGGHHQQEDPAQGRPLPRAGEGNWSWFNLNKDRITLLSLFQNTVQTLNDTDIY